MHYRGSEHLLFLVRNVDAHPGPFQNNYLFKSKNGPFVFCIFHFLVWKIKNNERILHIFLQCMPQLLLNLSLYMYHIYVYIYIYEKYIIHGSIQNRFRLFSLRQYTQQNMRVNNFKARLSGTKLWWWKNIYIYDSETH